jgi:glycosyltransferase involved in cell wall biosynthesis
MKNNIFISYGVDKPESGMTVCSELRYEELSIQYNSLKKIYIDSFDTLNNFNLVVFIRLFLKSLFTLTPIGILRFKFPNGIKYINDNIFLENICTSSIINHCLNSRLVLMLQNADHLYVYNLSKYSKNIFRKIFFLWEFICYRRYIKKISFQIDEIWCMTERDFLDINNITGINKSTIKYKPLLFNIQKPSYDRYKSFQPILCYLGTSNHIFNVEGLVWYLKNVHKSLLHSFGPLIVIGSGWDDILKSRDVSENLYTAKGFVDDINSLLCNHAPFFVSPVFDGSGIKIKVLSTLKNGYKTIASSHSAAGFELIDDDILCVINSKNPNIWIDKICNFINF